MRIGLKLTFGYLVVAALVAAVGLSSYFAYRTIERKVDQFSRGPIVEVADASAMLDALNSGQVAAFRLAHEQVDATAERAAIESSIVHFQRSLDRSRGVSEAQIDAAERAGDERAAESERRKVTRWLNLIERRFLEHRQRLQQYMDMIEKDPVKANEYLRAELHPHYRDEMVPVINGYRDRSQSSFARGVRETRENLTSINRINNVASIVSLLTAIAVGFVVARSIIRPLRTLKDAVAQIGQGNLKTEIKSDSNDEIGLLANAFRQMTVDLEATTVSKAEKEVLLKEIHHRVKNNLQIISSLLNLQSHEAQDPYVASILRESQGRIRSMALIHEQLHQSEDLAHIDFDEYVRRLTNHLLHSQGPSSGKVRIDLQVENVQLPLDLAIPNGMIVNELVSNAFKHAFPDGRAGRVRIGFQADRDCHRLIVEDDGVGMPDDDARARSLGLKVVEALVKQLHGELSVTADEGTKIEVVYGGIEQENRE